MSKNYKIEEVRKDLYRLFDTRTATTVGVFFKKDDLPELLTLLKELN